MQKSIFSKYFRVCASIVLSVVVVLGTLFMLFTARYFSGEQPHVLYSVRRADAAACFFAGSMLP